MNEALPNGSPAVAPWMQTASGLALDMLAPTPAMVTLGDIAHHLARIPRFNGATLGDVPWNVAQHSLLVAELMPPDSPPQALLAALLHDAPEAYVGDMIAPMKAAVRSLNANGLMTLDVIESRLRHAILTAFALPSPLPNDWARDIKHADLQALRIEAEQLMAPPPADWIPLPETPNPPKLICLLAPEAQKQFTTFALSLIAERHGVSIQSRPSVPPAGYEPETDDPRRAAMRRFDPSENDGAHC